MKTLPFDIATRFIGIKEIPGTQDNPQILAMLKLDENWPEHDEVPWCSAFINYICWLLRLPRSKSLMARSWLDVGTMIPMQQAMVGSDIVILDRPGGGPTAGHVGFYAGDEEHFIGVLGGNQQNMVSVKTYRKEQVLGIRRLS